MGVRSARRLLALCIPAIASYGCGGDARSPVAPTVVPAQPFVIQAALDAAPLGATVVVPTGTYRESLRIAKAGVTLTAEPDVVLDGSTFPDGPSSAVPSARVIGVLIDAPDVTVRGLTILWFHTGIVSQAAGCHIIGNYIGHGRSPNPYVQSIAIELVAAQWFRRQGSSNCEVSGNTIRGINGRGMVIGGPGHIVRNNVVADVENYGMDVSSAADAQIIGNQVSSAKLSGMSFSTGDPRLAPTVRNLVAENQVSGIAGQGISVRGPYTRDNRFERNRASANASFDLFTEDLLCRADFGNVWRDNQGTTNCAIVR